MYAGLWRSSNSNCVAWQPSFSDHPGSTSQCAWPWTHSGCRLVGRQPDTRPIRYYNYRHKGSPIEGGMIIPNGFWPDAGSTLLDPYRIKLHTKELRSRMYEARVTTWAMRKRSKGPWFFSVYRLGDKCFKDPYEPISIMQSKMFFFVAHLKIEDLPPQYSHKNMDRDYAWYILQHWYIKLPIWSKHGSVGSCRTSVFFVGDPTILL